MNKTELLKIAKPILFNTEMVRAILDGRKTVTRRVVPEKVMDAYYDYDEWCESVMPRDIPCTRNYERDFLLTRARYKEEEVIPCEPDDKYKHLFEYKQENEVWVAPADYLYVRETFARISDFTTVDEEVGIPDGYIYKQENELLDVHWKPSIHMPKEAARIFLKVTGVRVERLQDITEEQARAEGITDGGCTNCGNNEPCGCEDPSPDARDAFFYKWNNIYGWDGEYSTIYNPWVWVYEFERVEPDV